VGLAIPLVILVDAAEGVERDIPAVGALVAQGQPDKAMQVVEETLLITIPTHNRLLVGVEAGPVP
jgi:hypothetical protein